MMLVHWWVVKDSFDIRKPKCLESVLDWVNDECNFLLTGPNGMSSMQGKILDGESQLEPLSFGMENSNQYVGLVAT